MSTEGAAGRVVVVGAGLSGLACAYDLARDGREVTVLEAAPRAGGVVSTTVERGFRFENGPNTLMATAPAFRGLVHDLGLDDRLVGSRPEAADRFLYFRGALRPLPRGPGAFARTPLLSARAKLRLLTEPLRRYREPRTELEPTLGAFLEDRLGPEPARVLGGAFVRGVYAAELDELGAASAFPRLFGLASEHGGLVRGALARRKTPRPEIPGPSFPRGSLLTFRDGLGELVDALAHELGERLVLGAPVESLARTVDGWRIVTGDGRQRVAAAVVLAVPAPIAARLLEPAASAAGGGFPLEVLTSIEHADLTLVHLGVARDALPLPPGFGFLVPPGGENVTGLKPPGVLGTIFVSSLFPGRAPEGFQAVSCFYRTRDLGPQAGSDEHVVRRAAHDLARAVGAPHAPAPGKGLAIGLVRRWSNVLPRYAPGHARRIAALLARLEEELPGIELAGNYVAGVSVDQVIDRGRAVARRLLAGSYDRAASPKEASGAR